MRARIFARAFSRARAARAALADAPRRNDKILMRAPCACAHTFASFLSSFSKRNITRRIKHNNKTTTYLSRCCARRALLRALLRVLLCARCSFSRHCTPLSLFRMHVSWRGGALAATCNVNNIALWRVNNKTKHHHRINRRRMA